MIGLSSPHNRFSCFLLDQKMNQTSVTTITDVFLFGQLTLSKFASENGFIFQTSNPSRSHVNCCGLKITISSLCFFGHGNRSVSRRFCQRQKPLLSKYKTLMLFLRLPQNTKRFLPAMSPMFDD